MRSSRRNAKRDVRARKTNAKADSESPDLFSIMEQVRRAEQEKQAAASSSLTAISPPIVSPASLLTSATPANRDLAATQEFSETSEIPKTTESPVDVIAISPTENFAKTPAERSPEISRAPQHTETPSPAEPLPEPIPARMLNEFVYCARLFYYEYVEGVFVQSADTVRGSGIHRRVDSGSGAMPPAAKQAEDSANGEAESETIHSRSVQLGSERLGVTAKMDLIEAQTGGDDGGVTKVCPVDYKAGSPREGEDGNTLWDTDKMQLGLQCLILRDNGYACDEGVIYYRGTKQRVRLAVSEALESWVVEKIAEARAISRGGIPAPLVASPKCVRCSLAPVCLPDETRLLASAEIATEPDADANQEAVANREAASPRRLIASRSDSRALYLNTPGLHVGRSDEVLQVREKGKLLEEIRIGDLCHVSLFGNIQLSTQAVQTLCEREVPVTWFSMGGWFYGITRGHSLKNVFLRIEQFRAAASLTASLPLAKAFVHGKIRNQRTLLMRNHVEPPEVILRKLKNSTQTCLSAESLETLLGIEGAAAAFYFQNFGGMLKPGDDPQQNGADALRFDFSTRNRRPPTDPVNAMLSLAYSLLAKECTLAAYAVGFDPYVGFYHQPRFGRPALALDVMEEFRPLIAESVVVTIINNRSLTTKDFVVAGKAVNLSPTGRKLFFQSYEKRMNSLVTHPVFDYKVSYRRAIELQFRILARAITGEIPEYIPFTTR